jgi:hypothetical protein
MDERSRDVLAAADSWLTAIQAITAADEEQRRTADQQLDLDDAEVALAAAVLAWRDACRTKGSHLAAFEGERNEAAGQDRKRSAGTASARAGDAGRGRACGPDLPHQSGFQSSI